MALAGRRSRVLRGLADAVARLPKSNQQLIMSAIQSFLSDREERVEGSSVKLQEAPSWQEWLVHWRAVLPIRRSVTSCRNVLTGMS